jgi:hypothetical protein
MMPTMTKTSCRVLCLGLLLATQAFLVYPSSLTAKANIKKPELHPCQCLKKGIGSALVHLHLDETTTNDKWSTLEAIHKLIYSRFDFNYGIYFPICELKKAANEVGPLWSKISQGNHTIVRSPMMELRWTDFVNVAKTSREMPRFNWPECVFSTTTRRIYGACLLYATSVA